MARRLALHRQIASLDPEGSPELRLLPPLQDVARGLVPRQAGRADAPSPLPAEAEQGGRGPSSPTIHPSPSLIALLPGSFDPFTRAHAALARAALETPPRPIQHPTSNVQDRPDLLLLTLTQRTVDKEDTHVASLEDRALLLQHWAQSQRPSALSRRLCVGLCNRGLYLEQAQAARHLFPPPAQLVFVVGYDKLIQILDPRYYDRRDAALAELFTLSSLWVAPRGAGDAQAVANLLALPENRRHASAIHLLAVPRAFAHLSATAVRAALQTGRLPRSLLPATTLRFIRDTGTYLPKPGSAIKGATPARGAPCVQN